MLKIPQIPIRMDWTVGAEYGGGIFGSDYAKPEYVNFLFDYEGYSVTVNGRECPVRGCRVSAIPFNREWPGKQRDVSQTELAGFVTFSADEEVTVRVTCEKNFEKPVLRPLSKNVLLETEGREIVFRLKEQGSYVLELDDFHNALHIFFNPVKEYPEAAKATYYFGPGLHFPGTMNLRDNDTVYIDEEAVVFGSVYSTGARNIKIYGGGILDNTCEERISAPCYENHTKGTFRIYGCEDVTVEDVIMMNSSTWILSMFYCDKVYIDGVKLVGHWRYNTDGIDVVNTSNVVIKNCFIRSFDDTISIKGIFDYHKLIENITVENCVLWSGWGHVLEAGVETWAPEYRNIMFKNCDVIHLSYAALAIANGIASDIHNVSFENINVEFQQDTLPQIMQLSDDMVYDGYGKPSDQILITVRNYKYRAVTMTGNGVVRDKLEKYGRNRDISFKNIRVYKDDAMKPKIAICSEDKDTVFQNVSIEGLFVNGVKQDDFSAFETDFTNCECMILR